MSKSLRIVFAGTPEFAASHLQAILQQGIHEVIGVYSQPDRPAGRGQKLVASPVKQLALAHNIPVFQPLTLRDAAAQAELAELKPDLMVVVAYGLILPQAVLDMPRLGCINSHASLLPRWRGAAPIQRAIEAGDDVTGVTVMQMEAGLDTGPMLHKVSTAITAQDTGGSLHDRLAELGSAAVLEVLQQLAEGTMQAEKQDDSLANYAHKLSKAEAKLNWQQSATELDQQIRAFNPWPVSHSQLNGQVIKVHAAEPVLENNTSAAPGTILAAEREGLVVACGEGALRLTRIQLPNARAMSVADVLNSKQELFPVGAVFDL
ncbi:methionyl-tRNA formyltransferase [Thiopseudomonas alkaliphila]|uniref:methionyl-tRNA formyltransferase n=1 Tax=Thiopseudomonas alkaliphila TaxID=1697053 RepID=UPI00069E5102|nr:methionyl-tRNA formyltransferase [Thiopseudomonas alkaliphila]AKX51191.1 methionyl-tRNA formyltransferase [Thiopseudomonas alkaliphila]AKX57548.1 methionyl-tRNA formyltransferase [Thiopseudomonas alkaliphila]MDM1716644.1 methionyl-tRNA formyltransferase [Thiopseudomonas alkaliphila]